MNKEATQIVLISAGILGVTILGVILLYLSKWSRTKNDELRAKGNDFQTTAFQSAMSKGNLVEIIKVYFTGSISRKEEILGKILSVAVIICVAVFLAFACILVLHSI